MLFSYLDFRSVPILNQPQIGVGLIGCGTVGSGVVQLLHDHAALYARRCGREMMLRRVLVRHPDRAIERSGVDADLVTTDIDDFLADEQIHIVIEVAGGCDPISSYIRRALETGRHVITANKSLLAAEGDELFALARRHGVSIAFEAACAGGVPCITALQFGLLANQTNGLYGILNGTCNYILTEMTDHGRSYESALTDAQSQGFAESDPTLDVSGQDSAQKLAILASLAFDAPLPVESISVAGIDRLSQTDIRFGAELGYDVKLLAIAERNLQQGQVSLAVEPCFIHHAEMLAQVDGTYNALSVYGHATGHTLYFGTGAGQMPTASAVVGDLLNVASGWYPMAFSQMQMGLDTQGHVDLLDQQEILSRFYVRLGALDEPGVMARVTTQLGDAGISIAAVAQHESKAGQYVPVVVITHHARRGDLARAIKGIAEFKEIAGTPVAMRIVDIPK